MTPEEYASASPLTTLGAIRSTNPPTIKGSHIVLQTLQNSLNAILELVIKLFKVFGVIFIIWGLFFLLFNISFIASSYADLATITLVLERKSGTNYEAVEIGSENPCKLRLLLSTGEELTTSEEHWGCRTLLYSYFRVGQKIEVRTDGKRVQLKSVIAELFIPSGIILGGIVSLTLPRKLLGKRK